MDENQQQKIGTIIKCNFCNRTQLQVKKLVAGPAGVYICDVCVEVAHSLITADKKEKERMNELIGKRGITNKEKKEKKK